ncbi:hypothetical protein NUW58_g4389 [Xylaria curta]|uniref:Uncharacterized protein n=1 Tax=Xylaria curta TaxID=42375 RepID=A0ACC1P7R0_9PEZI|nr:hypothetical protein NUW58_g4389 [Xylaria curta]
MADPLSIAASIAGVITLADIVFLRVMKYARAVGEANKQVEDLAREINVLGGALASVSRLARGLSETDQLGFNRNIGNLRMYHIQACDGILTQLNKKLKKAEERGLGKRFIWPFSSDHMKDMLADLSQHKQSINLALSSNSTEMLLRHLSQAEEIQATTSNILKETRETRKIVYRIHRDEERDKVLGFFFETWLSLAGSRLWFSGIPGAGKTVLAGTIIEAALSAGTHEIPTAFFFCDYKDDRTHSAVNILSAILYQLAIQKEEAYVVLEKFYHELHPPRSLTRSPDLRDVKRKLREIMNLFHRVYLVVDGLDECGDQTDEVVRTLSEVANDSDNLSVALLSRDEIEIREYLEDDFVGVEIAAHTEDVTEFVTAEIEERIRNRRLRIEDFSLKGEILQGLVDGAKGMFRWVACQLDHLGECLSDSECREALNKLPPTLNETYTRILQKVPRGKIPAAEMILHFVAYAQPKLTIRQLREALSAPRNANEIMLDSHNIVREGSIAKLCSSLVRRSNDGERFELAHASVKDFFESDQSIAPESFKLSKSRCDKLLALQCLGFLQAKNFHHSPSAEIGELSYMEERDEEWKFYNYAALYWPTYARYTLDDKRVFEAVVSLFSPKKTAVFTSWVVSWACQLYGGSVNRNIISEKEQGLLRTIAQVVDEDFTPLHAAAALSLPAICQDLLKHGIDANTSSRVGTPLQCAIEGLCFVTIFEAEPQRLALHFRLFLDPEDTVETVYGLFQGGANISIERTGAPFGLSLIGQSFCLRRFPFGPNLKIAQSFLSYGVELTEADLRAFEDLMGEVHHCHHAEIERPLELFIKFLSSMVNQSALLFKLCSAAWSLSIDRGLDFTVKGLVMDTRISLSADELNRGIFAAVEGCNLEAVEKLLQDPRLQISELTNNAGKTLLHVVLGQSFKATHRVAICKALLNAGCNVSKTDAKGAQPIHEWDWEHQDESEYAVIVECFANLGIVCSSQDQNGRNSLHLHANSLSKLKAFINFCSKDDVATALATIDGDGYTPISRAISQGYESSALFLLGQSGLHPATLQSPIPVLLLAVKRNAVGVFDRLFEVESLRCQIETDYATILHHIMPNPTVEFVNRLKSLHPDACKTQLAGILPLSAYMRKCICKGSIPKFDVVDAICPRDILGSEINLGSQVWEDFAIAISEAGKKRYSFLSVPCEKISELLLKIGVVRCFERVAQRSAILALLEPFHHVNHLGNLYPISSETICAVLCETEFWTELRESSVLTMLLKAGIRSSNLKVVKVMLENGADIHRRTNGFSALDVACQIHVNTHLKKEVFSLLLQFADASRLDETSIISGGLGLLHYLTGPKDEWAISELVKLGATPDNCAAQNPYTPALVQHLIEGSLESSMSLLRNGADPTKSNSLGFDAILGASFGGVTPFLAELYNTRESKWKLDWQKTCVIWYNNVSVFRASGLHVAAAGGSVDCLKFYLDHGRLADLEVRSDGLHTPLHLAAMYGRVDAIKYLLLQGANVNARSSDGSTPLHLAVKSRQLEAARALADHGCQFLLDSYNMTPILYAYNLNDHAIIRYLSAQNSFSAVSSTQQTSIPISEQGRIRDRAHTFWGAIRINDLRLCSELRVQGCSLEIGVPPCWSCSPLIVSISERKLGIIEWLLENDALTTVYACNQHKLVSAVALLVGERSLNNVLPSFLEKYLQDGGSFLSESPRLISIAIDRGNDDCLELLFAHLEKNKRYYSEMVGENPESAFAIAMGDHSVEAESCPSLCLAIQKTKIATIATLIKHGANVNAICCIHETPLHLSVMSSESPQIVQLLLQHGAAVDSRTCLGETPLMYTSSNRHFNLVNVLLEAGSNTSILSYDLMTALHSATRLNTVDTVLTSLPENAMSFAAFLCQGLDAHQQNSSGNSAFHSALGESRLIPIILNSDLRLEDSSEFPWATISSLGLGWLMTPFRILRRKFGREQLKRFMNLEPTGSWSPLCITASLSLTTAMRNLIDIGAQIDFEGCTSGSALMVACEAGQLDAVRLLVRQKAKLTYRGPAGFRSAFEIAKKCKSILQWLLVDRFLEQRKLCPTINENSGPTGDGFKLWSGVSRAELVIIGKLEKQATESAKDYWIRLRRAKVGLRGKVLPLSPRCRTSRPSRLIPTERVRIHPGGYNTPQRDLGEAGSGNGATSLGP